MKMLAHLTGAARTEAKAALRRLLGERCECCAARGALTIHHIVPQWRGGGDTINNLSLLCNACHESWHSYERRLVAEHCGRVAERLPFFYARWIKQSSPLFSYA